MAKTAAMPHHQPNLRAQHRQVIGNRLGVGWPHADIHQRYPCAIGRPQMVSRHLEAPPGRAVNRCPAMLIRLRNLQPSGHGKRSIAALPAQLLQRPVTERVHIAVIVREQHIMLEMLHRRAGIMLQPLQREIHPLRIKKGQRPLLACLKRLPIGHLVANQRQLRRGKPAHQLRWRYLFQPRRLRGVPNIGIRNFRRRAFNEHVHIIIPHQRGQHFHQIVAEKFRPRDGGDIDTGFGEFPERARNRRRRPFGIINNAQLRIAEGALVPQARVRRRAVMQERVESVGKGVNRLRIKRLERFDNCFWFRVF